MSTASKEDGMDYYQLSLEEQRLELNRCAIPISAEAIFSFNSNPKSFNNAGVNYSSSISNLTNDGKTFMPHNVGVDSPMGKISNLTNEGLNAPMGNISNLTNDGKNSMPHNNVGVTSPMDNIPNLTSDGKISTPESVVMQELRSSETSQELESNLSLDGKTSMPLNAAFMPQNADVLRSSNISQQPVSSDFISSSFGKISMPKNAFENSLNRTPEELERFRLSHKFIVFKKGSPGSSHDIVIELSLEQVEKENLVRLIPNQWTTIPGNNCVVFATFDSDFAEEDASSVVKSIESDFKKSFNIPAGLAGMDSVGSTSTNTRAGIDVRFWFNRSTSVINDLVESLTRIILKKDSLAGIFNCLRAPMVVARHFIRDATGVAEHTIEQVFKFYGVAATCLTPESRIWGAHKATKDKEITSAESWHVTLTYPSEGSKLPKGEFQIEVPTMDGSTTSMKVLFGFPYSKTSELSKPALTKYKTIVCKYYKAHNYCKQGSNCTFAHGDSDRVDSNLIQKRGPLVNTKMCRSVQLGKECYRSRCTYAHKESELVSVEVQGAVPVHLTAEAPLVTRLKDSAPVSQQQIVSDPKLREILKHGSAAASEVVKVSHTVQELEAVHGEMWDTVNTSKGRSKQPLQVSSPAGGANYYEVLEDGLSVLPKLPIPIGNLSHVPAAVRSGAVDQLIPDVAPVESSDFDLAEADTFGELNLLKPIFSEPLVHTHVSKTNPDSDLGSAPPSQIAEHTHLFLAIKHKKDAFKCHKCKCTSWKERFRCTRGLSNAPECLCVLCPMCHKTHAKSVHALQSEISPTKSPKGNKGVTGTTSASPKGGVVTAKIPLISEVTSIPTTPSSSIVNNVASKRKINELSPSAALDDGDKIPRTVERATDILSAASPLLENNTVQSLLKNAGDLSLSPTPSQISPMTRVSGQKKRQ